MDIHLDRWLEHVPMPPEMPDGHAVGYSVMLGSDLQRLWWGAWGHPTGFVPRMANYFKLCNMDKSDTAIIDQVGEALEPKVTGSWIGVAGGKVSTGWHFLDPYSWEQIEPLFGTHAAKFQLRQFLTMCQASQVERFSQSIGESAYSEVEVRLAGDSREAQLALASQGFVHFTGAPLEQALLQQFADAQLGQLTFIVRIRGGNVTRVALALPGYTIEGVAPLCAAAGVAYDANLPKLVGAVGSLPTHVEYGRAGNRAGVDVFLEPSEPQSKAAPAAPPAANTAN